MKQPHIFCAPGDISENVLIAGDPGRILRAAEHLENWKEIAYNREFRTVTGSYQGVPITLTSTGIGGASTAIAVEELIICGAKRIIRIGSAGALQPHINVGDLIIATAAVRDDGTSHKYVPAQFPAVADPELAHIITETCKQLEYCYYRGIIHSHDSLYTDNQTEIDAFWHKKGVIGSEMESATLFTISHLRRVKAAAILNNVVRYGNDVKEGINEFNQSIQGEHNQIRLALESFRNFTANN